MDYKETDDLSSDAEKDEEELPPQEDLENELNFSDIEEGADFDPSLLELNTKDKNPQNARYSLKARRAIEDHLEQRRLRKELDYLFDDEFVEGEEKKKE